MRSQTHVGYNLDHAAAQLQLSDSVLLRLSQFFRVPVEAYEEMGAMSFKPDPVFYDSDIQFFKEVKKRLLAGETLQQLKQRIPVIQRSFPQVPQSKPEPQQARYTTPPPLRSRTPLGSTLNRLQQPQPAVSEPVVSQPPTENNPDALREIPADDASLSDAAKVTFEHYKKNHDGLGLKKIFQKLLGNLDRTTPQGIEDFDFTPPPTQAPPQAAMPEAQEVHSASMSGKDSDVIEQDTHLASSIPQMDAQLLDLPPVAEPRREEAVATGFSALGTAYPLSETLAHAAQQVRQQAFELYHNDNR